MKKKLLTILVIASVICANAQSDLTFKPFKVDLAIGYALPAGSAGEGASGRKGGIVSSVEPKYALSDYLTLGLRMETAITLKGNTESGNLKASGSYLATADYYFTTNTIRPFAGIGAGYFRNASADLNSSDVASSSKLGFAPRVGFETGHFRTAVEYNFAGKTEGISNNYLALKIGFFLGGGRYDY